jgi:ubiquinone/menaquinone biosynthesis C-methylase UbiE
MDTDLYGSYADFEADALARVRRRAFDEDFGQNSWTSAEEYRRWATWLALGPAAHVLEIACGSGGPAVRLAELSGARVTGIDVEAQAVATANGRAAGLDGRVSFRVADAAAALPFEDASFDALVCVDAANHLPDRAAVLREWRRVLKPGAKAVWTDPVVVTGAVSNEELATRSSIGYFLFVQPGVNETLLQRTGFRLERVEDATLAVEQVAGRWHAARKDEREALETLEGPTRYEALQRFFDAVHRLAAERRLSRFVYYCTA